jgi:CRISPR/Cas system CMR-associated protein Cmr1 (group 7 of RAMP superfamily)
VNTQTYHIEFLTPCFCGGANQNQAELRASAIRGELRWWFRVLGGSATEERDVFGGVHGEFPAASKLVVRARSDPGTGEKEWFAPNKIPRQGMDRGAYLLGFFCGRTDRLQTGGALPPGSTANVWVTLRQPANKHLEQTLRLFFSLGGIGFRVTRTAGSFTSREHPLTEEAWDDLASELDAADFASVLLVDKFSKWEQLVGHAGYLLKNRLRSKSEGLGISAGRNGTTPNALGSADPRQASVVHLRAVRINGILRLALLEPPHQAILGVQAQKAHGNRGSILRLANLLS